MAPPFKQKKARIARGVYKTETGGRKLRHRPAVTVTVKETSVDANMARAEDAAVLTLKKRTVNKVTKASVPQERNRYGEVLKALTKAYKRDYLYRAVTTAVTEIDVMDPKRKNHDLIKKMSRRVDAAGGVTMTIEMVDPLSSIKLDNELEGQTKSERNFLEELLGRNPREKQPPVTIDIDADEPHPFDNMIL